MFWKRFSSTLLDADQGNHIFLIQVLIQKLKSDLKQAMKTKEKSQTLLLKSLLSDITYSEKGARSSVFTCILKAIKKRQESLEAYHQAKRPDLVEVESREISILQSYLPKPLSDSELEIGIKEMIQSLQLSSQSDLGKLIQQAGIKWDSAIAPRQKIAEISKRLLAK